MTCELITGSAGSDHVSSADDGSMYASVFGAGRYAVKQGNDLAATMGNANSITIDTGAGFMDGRYWRVTSAETLTIDSGAQGINRIDLVGVKYQYDNGTGHETGSLAVVKGTATSGTPSTPTYTDGDILEGATEAFFPLYSIEIDGIVPAAPEKLFHFMGGTVSCPWPVGSVLQMTNATDPNNVYPGTTWSKIQGVFLLGSSNSHALGTTGGAESVTLNANNLPAHTHTYDKASANTGGTVLSEAQLPSQNIQTRQRNNNGSFNGYGLISEYGKVKYEQGFVVESNGNQAHDHSISTSSAASGSVGSGSAVNKMPPFKTVNMWERTA